MGASIVSSIAQLDATPVKGVRRSRFSLHLNTPRVRRWLLVQIVSIPVVAGGEGERQTRTAHLGKTRPVTPDPMSRLLDDYQTGLLRRRSL
ncbi:MAG TPA: hypothetical protein VEW94_03275 [Chloroflexia bacterium]|nr:hypothetical protein [Chloroflexia bacterium]